MIADLLELHEHGQHQATAGDPLGFFEPLGKVRHGVFIERGLLLGQPALDAHLRLVRQVGDDGGVGLHAPENIGADEPAQGAEGMCVLLLIESLDKLLEARGRAQ